MNKQKYIACWYCDNIIDHPEQIGLLHLSFPRCFVLVPDNGVFQFSTFEQFMNNETVCINWLDPNDAGTPKEQEYVLRLLWNFAIKQENLEDELVK